MEVVLTLHAHSYVAGDGGGAGNNWAMGFSAAQQHYEKICDMIDREAEV
jgi:tubulin gamma